MIILADSGHNAAQPAPLEWGFDPLVFFFAGGVPLDTGFIHFNMSFEATMATVTNGVWQPHQIENNYTNPPGETPFGGNNPTAGPVGEIQLPALYFYFSFVSVPGGLVGQHFDRFWYDPSLEFLFSPNGASSPNGVGLSPDTKVAIGVTIPIISIAVIAVIIVAWKVPAVNRFFRPFVARNDKQAPVFNAPDHHQAQPREHSSRTRQWSKGAKPADI